MITYYYVVQHRKPARPPVKVIERLVQSSGPLAVARGGGAKVQTDTQSSDSGWPEWSTNHPVVCQPEPVHAFYAALA